MSRKKITSKKKKGIGRSLPRKSKEKRRKKEKKRRRSKRQASRRRKIKNGRKRQCTNWAQKKKKKQPQRQHIGQARPWATAYEYFRHLSIKLVFFLF